MYSQYGEDDHVLKYVDEAGIEVGTVLEIGAWNATDKSNSRALIKRGWCATLVEPAAGPMIKIMRACLFCGHSPEEPYGDRCPVPDYCENAECPRAKTGLPTIRYGRCDDVRLIQGAVGFERGLIQLDITDDAVSSSETAHVDKWRAVGGYFAHAWIPQVTLEDLLNQFGGFTVVSFDAEGISVDLCIRYLALGQRPAAMIVEHDGRSVELASVTQPAGYRQLFINDCNVVYGL